MAQNSFDLDYSHLFQELPERYLVIKADDPVFTLVEENQAHSEIAMVKKSDIIGRPFFDVFPDTSPKFEHTGVSDLAESLRSVVRTGKPDTMEALRYDIKDEKGELQERYWQATHYPLFDTYGKVAFIFQQTEDITAQMISEQELVKTQKQLEEALAVGSIGTWFWDIKTNKVTADKNLAAMFGVSPDEAAAGLSLDVFTNSMYEEDRKRVSKQIEKAVTDFTQFEEEYRTISTDGSIRWVIARGKAEPDNSGNPAVFPGVIFDITDRKHAEQNLQLLAEASTALSASLDYNATLQNVAKIMVPTIADWCTVDILDTDGKVTLVAVHHRDPKKIKWAREYRKRSGEVDLNAPNGVGSVIREGVAEFYPEITQEMMDATARNDEERKLARELAICSAMTVPLSSQGKTVGAITFIATDHSRHYSQTDFDMAKDLAVRASLAMTNAALYDQTKRELIEREELQESLRQANAELEARVLERTSQLETLNVDLGRRNQELQDFAYVASHDLQEPLRKIQAFGDILHDEYKKELGEGAEYLVRMQSAAGRMSVLIEDLLSFSRVTTHAKDLEHIDLNQTAADVLEDLERRINDTGGIVTVDHLPSIRADPTQMRQLFQNLIGNALKFHKTDVAPQIKVTTKEFDRDGQQWYEIRVADNGVGFDEKYLDRIFAVFQRLHGRGTYEGTGIGLAVCRKIVERHGGSITAKSKPDHGSTFIIQLPKDSKKKARSK